MDHPSQIFRRIRRRKARPIPSQHRQDAVAPAPVRPSARHASASGVPQPPAPPEEHPPEPSLQPRPSRGHALYSQVMRSHDRMGTRHLT